MSAVLNFGENKKKKKIVAIRISAVGGRDTVVSAASVRRKSSSRRQVSREFLVTVFRRVLVPNIKYTRIEYLDISNRFVTARR